MTTTTRNRNFTVNQTPLLPTLGMDVAGVPGAGSALAPTFVAMRLSDGFFWNAAGGAWQAGVVLNPMIEPDAVNVPGFYMDLAAGIPVAQLDPAVVGYEFAIYYQELVTPYQDFEQITLEKHVWNELETDFFTAGAFIGSFGELMIEIASLSFRFYREYNHVYNAQGQLTSCSIRTYARQADAIGNVNPIRTITFTTSYAANRPDVVTGT